MTALKRKLTAGVAAAVVAVGGGLAVANIGSGEGTASATQQQGQMGGGPPGQSAGGDATGARGGGPDLSALAEDLGVSESRLQTAMQDAMPGPGSQPSGDRGDMAAELAQALDLPEADVQEALEANRPSGGQGQAPPAGGQAPSSSSSGATQSS